MDEIVPELRTLYAKLNVNNVLSGWSIATRHVEQEEMKNADIYLLVLDPNVFRLTITPYQRGDLAAANAEYAVIEKDHPELQAVLVSVDSISALKSAYPNYFLDTTAFLRVVDKALGNSKDAKL